MLTRFAAMFILFGFLLVVMFGFVAYGNEMNTYTDLQLELTKKTGEYLKTIIDRDGQDFKKYTEYFETHHDTMHVPMDYDDYNVALDNFNKAFAKEYPGKVFEVDVSVDELSDELKELYYVYDHEYWGLTFEDARKSYGFVYIYFLQMHPETEMVTYMIDIERIPRENDPDYMYLGDTILNPYTKFPIEWDVFNSGKPADEFQIWDNAYGHNYAYYTPVVVDGKVLGVIGVEVQIDTINQTILINTLKMSFSVFIVMLVAVAGLLYLVNKQHLKKILALAGSVRTFSESKDPAVADEIEKSVNDGTELSYLAEQIAAMIRELDGHVKKLVETAKELAVSQMREAAASELAIKDSLTGIRNKRAYDNMCQDINFEIEGGFKDFGIVMIDLNFLKRINDTYGHDKGNISIIKLCNTICHTFQHSPVFRIGGDEFVVVLQGEDYRNGEKLTEEFMEEIRKLSEDEKLQNWERISAATGIAMFDGTIDKTVENTFKRADEKMYENKRKMKATRA